MKFAITGHLGLIGSSLKKRLEDEGNKCVFKIDIREGKDILYDMYGEKCNADILFHLASRCKINKCISDPEWCLENVLGVHETLEFCRKNNIKRIVAFSSSRVLSEERNPYTASKIYLEELCKAYYKCYNIEYIIIRPSTVYGPFNDVTHRLVDIWIRNALNGKDLIIYGDDKKTLDFTYINDFVDGMMFSLGSNPNNEYNISGNEESNLKELAEFIIKETNSKSKISFKLVELEQPQKVRVDVSAIKKLGYNPKTKLHEGIKKTIKFYKDNNLR